MKAKYLVIVESPAKSKTIEKYLGSDFAVTSSKGHIRDLSMSGFGGYGVDLENNFTPKYRILTDKKAVVAELKKAAAGKEKIYLATDPDREGEAISWHLAEVLELAEANYERIVFNEVTKGAILDSFAASRKIDMDLVKSQETRRILDRIIGFSLSKLLQKKIGSKSAGRVQSVALKMIVDREREIEQFVPEEYWHLSLEFFHNRRKFKALLERKSGKKLVIPNRQALDAVLADLGPVYLVSDVATKTRSKAARPPFTTSSLQQEASNRFGYNARKTMMVAQKLYEGVNLASGRQGLITYMRTDSTRLSGVFIGQARQFITENFGEKLFRGYKDFGKKAGVQDAHEAIRPTSLFNTPEKVAEFLSSEEQKLYELIYRRALAAVMQNAAIEDTKVVIVNGEYEFDYSYSAVKTPGYLLVYGKYEAEPAHPLPLAVGDILNAEKVKLLEEQKFTNPPARYSEARLIAKMEQEGIGRPSTYAVTMQTLKMRHYVTVKAKAFVPTEQGKLTTKNLDEFFAKIINVKYTAQMEAMLDDIAVGSGVWYEELARFYADYVPLLDYAQEHMEKVYPVYLDETCPECGEKLVIRNGRYGQFTACSGFPACRYIKKDPAQAPKPTDLPCPKCGTGMIVERVSKRGRSRGQKFFACDRYPQCRATYSTLEEVQEALPAAE